MVPQHAPGGHVPGPARYPLPVRPDLRLHPLPLAGHRPVDCNRIVGEINSHYRAPFLTPLALWQFQELGSAWLAPGQLRVLGPVSLPEQRVRAGCAHLNHGA